MESNKVRETERVEMKINEVAALAGVTVRTLHYYDQIGLLTPKKKSDAGYRIYGNEELIKLQQILFFRELDFPLEEIKMIMENPSYDRAEAINRQHELLRMKRDRLDDLLKLLESEMKGNGTMSFKEFSDDTINKQKEAYRMEVRERWGNTDAYKEYVAKKQDSAQLAGIADEGDAIIGEFSECRNEAADSPKAQELVKKWKEHISKNYYTCTNEILAGLGQMYVGDERFKENIDRHGAGTANFMSAAIAAYCEN